MAFSYPEVGATKEVASLPAHYAIDHYHLQLGSGAEMFERAKQALRQWQMFKLGWVKLCWPETPLEAEREVAILIRHFGLWSLNASRIVYVLDEESEGVRRCGFAYGTLVAHAESGEERFVIEWNRTDDSVCYEIFAFSRPRAPLARFGHPLTRKLQKKFGEDSLAVMQHACAAPTGLS